MSEWGVAIGVTPIYKKAKSRQKEYYLYFLPLEKIKEIVSAQMSVITEKFSVWQAESSSMLSCETTDMALYLSLLCAPIIE